MATALVLLVLPACVGNNNYVHNTDQQEAQMRASYQQAQANAAREASMAAMMGQMNSMIQQNRAGNNSVPFQMPQPAQGMGKEGELLSSFINACQSGESMQAATLLGQATALLTDDPAMKSVIDQMSQLVEMQAGGGQGPGDMNHLLSQLTQSGEGSGLDLNIITDFVKACESGETLEAATLLGRATSGLTDDPELKTMIDQMTRLVEMQAGGGQGITTGRPVEAGGFGASRGRSTGGTRKPQQGGGFQAPRAGAAPTSTWEVPPEIVVEEPEPEEVPPLTGIPEGQAVFKGIAAGYSLSVHIREHLGKPVKEVKGVEFFEAEDEGVVEAAVKFGTDGTALWARIRLVNELDPELARIAFHLSDRASRSKGCPFRESETEGWTEHHPSAGVYFHVHGGVVREIWLARPGEEVTSVESVLGSGGR